MFDRSPGFLLSKQQCIKNMAMDHVKFKPAEKKLNAEELKEWAARRMARAKTIEKLGNYESYECSDWPGEVPHNFMRNMREVGKFESLAMTPFVSKGQRNQAWTIMETSSCPKKKIIRFFTVRNGQEIPFTFILEKVVKCHSLSDNESSGIYNLTVHKCAKFANNNKFENEVKQFFASTRHLYDFITNEIWSHIDTMLPLPNKNAKTTKNFRNLQPITEVQTSSAESQKSLTSSEIPREVENSSDQNMKRDNSIAMQNKRKDQGFARGGVIPRGSHISRSFNSSLSRGGNHPNSTLRSNFGINKENCRYNSHSNTNSPHNTSQDVRRGSGFRTNSSFSPNILGSNWNSRKDSQKEVQSFAAAQGNVATTTKKLETPKDVNIVNKDMSKNAGPLQTTTNFHDEKIFQSRGGSFNSSRNVNNRNHQ